MIKKWNITIPQLTGKTKRRAYVYLPTSYYTNKKKRYPVLYMFDGHNVFFDEDATYGKSWGLAEYLDFTDAEIIVAAVECNHSPDHGRLKEYSPFDFSNPEIGSIKGKGKITMDWMINTFKPYIDKRFRTLKEREHTFIAGSSMGGLMSLYALLQYNQYFSRAAALSPSIWCASAQMKSLIRDAKLHPDTVLYMDYGSKEMSNHSKMRQHFAATVAQLIKKNIHVESRIVPGGTHCEASWEKQIPFFMNTLLYQP